MKSKVLLATAITALSLSSCIKDEPLGKETDIVSFKIEGDEYVSSDISETTVSVIVTEYADLLNIIPQIEVSQGATISPESGVKQDFSEGPVTYRITSEDKKYWKDYTVSFIKPALLNLVFDFENWEESKQGFYNMMLKDNNNKLIKLWDSGNPGIAFVNKGEFATAPTSDAYKGNYAAKLETLEGNINFVNLKIPIFSGSLFYGNFTLDHGIGEPRKCLMLGQYYPSSIGKPLKFTGYYKYKPGSKYVYLDSNNNVQTTTSIKDEMSIYAVLFKVDKKEAAKTYLDGITIMDSEKIVARADWKPETASITDKPAEEGKGFTRFEIPFIYKEGEELDFENYIYKITILFASSKDGNEYKGAIGSTLIVDEVEIISETPIIEE
ncbi:PCMD domain-containing protein [Dysgonomonas sp. Marseille-P4677]|uniref:PCMD domain-containing protein n=1 Tax=Dysgonomonas sp. Marseille-P4677 TaxID=2364790 RepID=UPI0019124E47|nr:PCMD domain-containing protein [Dysgonomonas sp. Marseille-P4677]MBK5723083.1 PCMD domain-containing protein [Dysgonomonas sp. Marseille-P4677]